MVLHFGNPGKQSESPTKCVEVNNCVDSEIIVENFASHFSAAYTPNNPIRANQIAKNYLCVRSSYCGLSITDEHAIDFELVSSVIS